MSIDPRLASAFDRAFAPGFSVRADGADVPVEVLDLGRLALPSGRLVACDPLTDLRDEPFAAALPPGRHPVRLAVVKSPAWGDRTAFARLALGEGAAVRWEVATLADQNAAALGEGEVFGYPVDAGTGCFLDAETARALLADDAAAEAVADAWIVEKREGVLYPCGEANVAVFHSGFGDGFYATYLGRDAAGAVVAAVTDFAVIDWAKQP